MIIEIIFKGDLKRVKKMLIVTQTYLNKCVITRKPKS